jgi:hypothetical protein
LKSPEPTTSHEVGTLPRFTIAERAMPFINHKARFPVLLCQRMSDFASALKSRFRGVGLGLAVGLGLVVGLGLAVGRGLAVGLGLAVGRGLAVGLGLAVGRGLAVGEGLGEGAPPGTVMVALALERASSIR